MPGSQPVASPVVASRAASEFRSTTSEPMVLKKPITRSSFPWRQKSDTVWPAFTLGEVTVSETTSRAAKLYAGEPEISRNEPPTKSVLPARTKALPVPVPATEGPITQSVARPVVRSS